MNKVLVLGAGLVSRPLVHYLLKQRDFQVTVASRTVSKAQALIAGFANGKALPLLADETGKLEALVKDHDLSISLLPAPLHPVIAEMCLRHRKHMVTTSYVSPKMKALDGAARTANITLLNEIGVDPGIDHMSAMRVIDGVRQRGGHVVSFRSYCGGLPAPEANNNPWGYKFSWSPEGVCRAGKNSAKFREDGKLVEVPGPDLFTCTHPLPVDGLGTLEAYPNRDSLSYIDVYGLDGVQTMFRGTLRYPGWCRCLKKVVDLNLLDESPVTYPPGMTLAQWTAGFIKAKSTDKLREQLAAYIKLPPNDNVLDRFAWLGLFSNDPVPITGQPTTALDVLAARMEAKMPYAPGERDMIVLAHKFTARFPAKGGNANAKATEEKLSSTLIDYGQPDGDSSMARTVSLPAAVATKLILLGGITDRGVLVPVKASIYNPVLDELATMNIRCVERKES